jgi:hypothetical protein
MVYTCFSHSYFLSVQIIPYLPFFIYISNCPPWDPNILNFLQYTGSTHLFSFMVLCFMCYSTCLPWYPWALSWRESWDQSVSYSWCSFLQQQMQFSISQLLSWWLTILCITFQILWMNAPLAFLELYSQWLSLRQVWVVCNHEGAFLSMVIIFDDLHKFLANIRMSYKNLT